MSYSFKLRFRVSERIRLPFEQREIEIHTSAGIRVTLLAYQKDSAINESNQLVLVGSGYATKEEAELHGGRARDNLIIAFSRILFPADFGDRAGKSFLSPYALEIAGKEIGKTVLNDLHGLQVFETESNPQFVTVTAKATVTRAKDTALETLKAAFTDENHIDETTRLAFELYSASAFSIYADARFMLLMMALETLIEQQSRGLEEQELIDQLQLVVKNSKVKNKNSLLNALESLRLESIGSAGKRLAMTMKKNYLQLPADKFFTHCYTLRSRLVHGHIPRPTFDEVSGAIGGLELLVTDLISAPYYKG